jgi:hypothetical protein
VTEETPVASFDAPTRITDAAVVDSLEVSDADAGVDLRGAELYTNVSLSSPSTYRGSSRSVLRAIEGTERPKPSPNGPLPAPDA